MDLEELIQRRGKIIPNKKPLSIEIKKNISLLIFTLLSIIILISIVFLLNTTQDTQKGYSVIQEQLKKTELEFQNNELTEKTNRAQASQTIENNPLFQQMVKPEKVEYIEEPQNNINNTDNTVESTDNAANTN